MPRMTSHAELLHHRPTNCHCNRVIQFPCACPSNYRLQLSLYIYIYCYGAIIDEIPRRRYSDQIPVEGRGDGVSRDSSSLRFKLTTQKERRGGFLPKKIRNLFPESRDVRVITRPPVCKKESGQSLNRVFSFFVRIYA